MSDLARELIAENERTRSPFLDLGNCDLTDVPNEIGGLSWLESLTLASLWYDWEGAFRQVRTSSNDRRPNQLRGLGSVFALHGLRRLVISGTGLADLSALRTLRRLEALFAVGCPVANLSPIRDLVSLRMLDLSETTIADVEPLRSLTRLEVVDLGRSRVEHLEPLSGLRSLHYLDVSRTAVADLAPLAGLTSLRRLLSAGNRVTSVEALSSLHSLEWLLIGTSDITDVAPLASLRALTTLDLSRTPITDLTPLRDYIRRGLPLRWASHADGPAGGIYVEGCPLISPPAEIASQGNDAVLNYFHEREAGDVDHLWEAKLLILGEGGAGKTSLVRRLYQRDLPMPSEHETTRGIAIHRHEFTLKDGRRFRLNVWDFGGQEIYHATHQFFLTRRSLYVLLDDTRKDHKSVSDEGFRYWLELIDLFSDHSPVLIFQNEKGGRSKAIDLAGIKARFDNVKERYAGNLELPGSVDAFRDAIERYASQLSHIGVELPARWIAVRDDIERRAAQTPYITQQEYFDIYARHLPSDGMKALHLSRYLHDVGVLLHFQDDPLLARTVILQNEWATEAVFRILDDEGVKARLGRFSRTDCERVWQDSKYTDKQPELLALMQRFELCYALPDTEPPTWLAPQFLPPAKPATLAAWTEWRDRDLIVRYRYGFIPRGLISRLMIRLRQFVRHPELAWRTGVSFEHDQNSVLVEIRPSGNEIELRARGPEPKSLLLTVASDLHALNDSFQGLDDRVDRLIACSCAHCAHSASPAFYPERALRRRVEDRRLRVECPESYEGVDVVALLESVSATPLPRPSPETREAPETRRVRVFLASSSELREDRDAFELYFRQRNDLLVERGIYLEIVRWERFLDAVSDNRLQEEYNAAVRSAAVVVCLFFTKAGAATREEFEAAYGQFKATGRPRIFTFFKNAEIRLGSTRREDLVSLWAFQDRLTELGHYHTTYANIHDLQLQFRDQLDRLEL
jgi:internalin A